MASDRTTAPIVRARVSIVNVHMPSMPHMNTRTMARSEVRQFEVAKTMKPMIATTPSQPTTGMMSSPAGREMIERMRSMNASTKVLIGLKK